MQVLAVTLGNHAHKSWRAALTYEFAAGWAMQPVVQAEAEKVAANFPMAFHQRDGTWDLVALLGVQPGHSLAVSRQGQWLGRYIPALIRAHPFTLATPQGAAGPVLCVDESTGLIGEAGDGKAFFDSSGKPTAALSAMIELLRQVALSRARTRLACAALAEAGLMSPLTIGLRMPDGKPAEAATLDNLYLIDAEKLSHLSDEAFLALRNHDALALAYAQRLSLQQFDALDQMGRQRQMGTASVAPSAQATAAGVPGVTVQDSVLRFT